MQPPSPAYGRDLYEVLLSDHLACTAWDCLPPHMHMVYEKAAQALNVRLGMAEATSQLILIVHKHTASPVSDVTDLIIYVNTRLIPHDRFEVYVIENGHEVGYGWYEVAPNRYLTVYEERGKAREYDEQMGLSLSECFATEPMNRKGAWL